MVAVSAAARSASTALRIWVFELHALGLRSSTFLGEHLQGLLMAAGSFHVLCSGVPMTDPALQGALLTALGVLHSCAVHC